MAADDVRPRMGAQAFGESRAEKMITPETRHLMLGLADDYERTAHIVEGMASIHGALASVMASVYGLLPQ